MKKICFLVLGILFLIPIDVKALNYSPDSKYGTLNSATQNFASREDGERYVQGLVKNANQTYVVDEKNKTITILYIGYWAMWRSSGGNWVTQSPFDGKILIPLNGNYYNLPRNVYLSSEVSAFLSKMQKIAVFNVKPAMIGDINDFYMKYRLTSNAKPIGNDINTILIYSVNDSKITKFDIELNKPTDPISITYTSRLITNYNGPFDINNPGTYGYPADGMGINVKTVDQSRLVIGTVMYTPYLITIKYDDTPPRQFCNPLDAQDINSPYFYDYWKKTGTELNPIYTPTAYANICACKTVNSSDKFLYPAFRTAMYDENGGYYKTPTETKGTPNLKISCPVPIEENICTLENYNDNKLTEAEFIDCCEKGPAGGAIGFDDSICKAANDEFDLYCDTNLTETKTYKSTKDEIPGNDVCTIKCEEEGTLTFKESQFVIAGQKLNYDFDYNSKKVCKATYEMTPAQFQTNYNNIVTSRVAAYNDYLRAKKTYDDYVSAKKCEGSSNRTVYYTCSTGTLSGTSCLYKEDYTVYGSSTDSYWCLPSKTYGLGITGKTPSSVTCSDGTTSTAFSLTSSGSAPSGSCTPVSRVNVTNSYEATCTSNASDPATYNCDCKNTASLTCDAYDNEKARLASIMSSKYTIYTNLLSDESTLINKKNACDNFVTTVESNADFEYEIEEKATSSFELRESEVINSSNNIIKSTNNNINLMLNCGTTATSCSLAANGRSTLAYTNWDKLSSSTFTYTYPDVMYIDRITGKAMSTAPNDYYYGGYNYYTDYSTLTGRYDIRVLSRGTFGNFEQWKLRNDEMTCWYNVDNRLGPPKDDANYPEYGSNGIAFRVVKLSDLFPNNRESGTNWKSEETLINKIESKGDTIYTSEPKYRIVLTPSSMKQIRKYNAENPYNTWSDFKFEDGTTTGTSGFLEDMISKGIIKMEVTAPKEQTNN